MQMRGLGGMVAAIVLCLGLGASAAAAEEAVPLDATHFPDENFRTAVAAFDSNKDGSLSLDERKAVTKLDVKQKIMTSEDKKIASLEGIGYFPELTELECEYNKLTTLDVRKNPKLVEVDCDYNKLTALEVTSLPALIELECRGNQLTALDVTHNPALQELKCSSNQLQALDVQANPALVTLDCGKNLLTTLDVSNHTALTSLDCNENWDAQGQRTLATLTVRGATALSTLHCAYNNIAVLDVSTNTALTQLDCADNALAALDVSHNTGLTSLSCSNNAALSALSLRACSQLTFLNCEYTSLGSLDLSQCPSIQNVYCGDNQLTTINLAGCTKLLCLHCPNNKLEALSLAGNAQLMQLQCRKNALEQLDMSGCDGITMLDCSENQLTGPLHVNTCPQLKQLFCNNNQLTSLNVAPCPELILLDCTSNQLTALDVSQNSALTDLRCGGQRRVLSQRSGHQLVAADQVASLAAITDGSFDAEGRFTFAEGKDAASYQYPVMDGQPRMDVALAYQEGAAVTIAAGPNGTVTASLSDHPSAVTSALPGEQVILTAAPAGGYYLDTMTATSEGAAVPLTQQADGTRAFIMPAKAVTIEAQFALAYVDPNPTVNTETVTNPDGSTTTTVTKKDGTTLATTEYEKGGRLSTETKPDGSATSQGQRADGTTATTRTDVNGKMEAEATLSKQAVEEAKKADTPVVLPMPAMTASSRGAGASQVSIEMATEEPVEAWLPVANPAPGNVAVLVKADGTEQVLRQSVADEKGLRVEVRDGDTIKLVDNSKAFIDTDQHWAEEDIDFVTARELYSGVGDKRFAPDQSMSRAMIAKVLHNLEYNPASSGNTAFEDVEADKWYSEAVAWAAENDLMVGYDNGQFGVHDALTREQLATMLYRYKGAPAVSEAPLDFTDIDQISPYARDAMQWAVRNGIISGSGDGTLAPQAFASRAQVATMLTHLIAL